MNRKTRILYLITGLNIGGAEVVLYNLTKKINKKAFEIVVVSIIPIGEIGKKIEKEGFKVLSLNAKFKYNPLIFFRFLKILRKEKIDILHAHMFHANLLGRIAGKMCRVPIIISTIHNENFGGKTRELLICHTRLLGIKTVVISKKVGETMLKKRVVSKKEIVVIENGIDTEEFSPREDDNIKKTRTSLGIPKGIPVFLSVGRIEEQKGYPCLIDALEILDRKGINFCMLILGEGREREKIENLVKEKKLNKKIYLLGNKKNVKEYLTASDMFIMPSFWEGLPLALLEAMASGLIVVATEAGGIPGVINDKENGFLVEPKNSEVLAEKIAYVLNLPEEERKRIENKARKAIRKRFSSEKMIKEYEKIYEKLLEKR